MNLKNTEKKEHSIIELTIEVGQEEFKEAVSAAYKKNRGSVTLPGFRKGKAPRALIEKMYGESFFWEDAVNESYPAAYEAALEASEIDAVGKAEMEIVEITAEGYTFKANVPVKPEVSLSDYKGIEAVKGAFAVADVEIDEEIERMRKRNARIENVEREAKTGDTAVIDFKGFVDGVAFDGGKAEKYSLEIGSGSFIPGFEEQIVGRKTGDEIDVNIDFPAEYHAEELAGKPAVFKVKIHEVKESVLPELDDEFAKDVSEFDTIAELKASIEKNLTESRENTVKSAFENSVMEQLSAKVEADIPNAMIEAQLDTIVENMAYRMSSQGLPFDQYLQMTGSTLEQMREIYRPQAETQVKIGLALDKIVELEGLVMSEDDVEKEYTRLSEQYNMPIEQVRIAVNEKEMSIDLLRGKASDLVVEAAVEIAEKIEEPAPEKPKKVPAKKPAAKKAADKADKPAADKAEKAEKPAAKKTTKKAAEKPNQE